MAQPQIIRGTVAQILPVLDQNRDRDDLTLIIPGDASNTHPPDDAAAIAAANARLRAHIVTLPARPDLSNESIDADLACEYSSGADSGPGA